MENEQITDEQETLKAAQKVLDDAAEKKKVENSDKSGKGKTDEVDYDKLGKALSKELGKAAKEEKAAEKLFTQAELDENIETRLARAKSGSGRANEAQEALLKTANDQIDEYETMLKKQVKSQLTHVPDSVKKILLKMPLSDQLEWLADPENSINKRTQTPKTPQEARGTDSKEHSEVRQVI